MAKVHSDLDGLKAELARVEGTVGRLIKRREMGKRGEEPEPWDAVDLESEVVDRTALIVSAGSALFPDKWDRLCAEANDNGCCPDLVADLLGADAVQRLMVYARAKALAESDLLRLVSWDGNGGPKALATSEMKLTRQGLARLVGDESVPSLADEEEKDRRIVKPQAKLEDLVLSQPVLRTINEIIDAARCRKTVLENWGLGTTFATGRCITVLLYGPSGVGKTHCVEGIANALDRPMITGLVPGLVSMWVGQTEQNLGQLFRTAAQHDAVLLLDEIDHLGMERGDRRASRHDDAAVNTLLHLIDRHDGLVAMATNRAAVLDRALLRRVTIAAKVDRPSAKARATIWEKILGSVPTEGDIDYACLAKHALVGGEIRTAVLRAAFQAASRGEKVSQMTLCRIAREMTEGRTD